MLLADKCKYCGRLTVWGYINEFNERFCNKSHYQLYCAVNGYEVHNENLKPVNNWTQDE